MGARGNTCASSTPRHGRSIFQLAQALEIRRIFQKPSSARERERENNGSLLAIRKFTELIIKSDRLSNPEISESSKVQNHPAKGFEERETQSFPFREQEFLLSKPSSSSYRFFFSFRRRRATQESQRRRSNGFSVEMTTTKTKNEGAPRPRGEQMGRA